MDVGYIAGLFDGEGSASVGVRRARTCRCGYQFMPTITIGQKPTKETIELINSVRNFFGFGKVAVYLNKVEWTVRRHSDIKRFIEIVKPYTHLKKRQFELLEEIVSYLYPKRPFSYLNRSSLVPIEKEKLLRIVELVEKLRSINYITGRKRISLDEVKENIKNLDEDALKKLRIRSDVAIKEEDKERLIELYQKEKRSMYEIGKIFRCSYGAVRKALIRFKVPLRTRSEAFKMVWEKRGEQNERDRN